MHDREVSPVGVVGRRRGHIVVLVEIVRRTLHVALTETFANGRDALAILASGDT